MLSGGATTLQAAGSRTRRARRSSRAGRRWGARACAARAYALLHNPRVSLHSRALSPRSSRHARARSKGFFNGDIKGAEVLVQFGKAKHASPTASPPAASAPEHAHTRHRNRARKNHFIHVSGCVNAKNNMTLRCRSDSCRPGYATATQHSHATTQPNSLSSHAQPSLNCPSWRSGSRR